MANEALRLLPAGQAVEVEATLALAMAGDSARAAELAQDLNRRFPLDTQVQSLWLPTIQAQLALNAGNAASALNLLHSTVPMDLASIQFLANVSCLYPVYLRGEAYLAAGDGAVAATEFQRIIDHSGITWNCWTGALARLGLARAYALEAGISQTTAQKTGAVRTPVDSAAIAKARTTYQEFLTLWKDADADLPLVKQAKQELATLQ